MQRARRTAGEGDERCENPRQDGAYVPNPFQAEITPEGVNLSHLRRNLKLTPYERLQQLEAWVRMVAQLRQGFHPRRDGHV